MTIDGVSQSTGIERLVEVTATDDGIRVSIRDRKLGTELGIVIGNDDVIYLDFTDKAPDHSGCAGAVSLRPFPVLGFKCRQHVLFIAEMTVIGQFQPTEADALLLTK